MSAMPELNVLVVDDEPAVRQVLSSAINKAGYAVESAASAAEAMAKLDKQAFDVVISDVFMPVTDGIELSDGGVAHTACLGFGHERIVLALLRTHGLDPATWPEDVRQELWP